jgi:hypothetical protein
MFLFRNISKRMSLNGESLTSSFHHRVRKGDSLICVFDNFRVKIITKDSNKKIEENVFFRAKSSKFERFYVSYVFVESGSFYFEVEDTKSLNFVDKNFHKGEHDYKIKIKVDVVE